jgi:hypothetical protein
MSVPQVSYPLLVNSRWEAGNRSIRPGFGQAQPSYDVYQPQEPAGQEGMSAGTKIAIGLGIAAGAAAVIALALKGKIGAAKEEIVKLAEKIDFTPAKTIEEAQKFGKEKLGIKVYSDDFNLDALNLTHQGLVDVNNAAHGKAKMPEVIAWFEDGGKNLARWGLNEEHDNIISLNKNIFNAPDKHITEIIKERLENHHLFIDKSGTYRLVNFIKNTQLEEMINIYLKNPAACPYNDKIKLIESFIREHSAVFLIEKRPMFVIDNMFKNGEQKTFSLKDFQAMSDKERTQHLHAFTPAVKYDIGTPFDTIYHEMGHLQHNNQYSNFDSLGVKYKKDAKGNRTLDFDFDMNQQSEAVKDFINDLAKQRIAARVSWYATTSPGEFVPETYSRLVAGKKLDDEIMALYKSYGGPAVG